LEDREFVGEIPIQAGTTPQQIALVSDQKLYVTCAATHEVHVVDIDNRNVTKVLTGPSTNRRVSRYSTAKPTSRTPHGSGIQRQE